MKVDVENISKNKKIIWRPIYEVINAPFVEETKMVPPKYQTNVKNPNLPQFSPSGVKVDLKRMAMEQGLYAQLVMIGQKDPDKKGKGKDQEYNFQGQSARPIRWFDLDHEWLEENFSTREPDISKILSNKYQGS